MQDRNTFTALSLDPDLLSQYRRARADYDAADAALVAAHDRTRDAFEQLTRSLPPGAFLRFDGEAIVVTATFDELGRIVARTEGDDLADLDDLPF